MQVTNMRLGDLLDVQPGFAFRKGFFRESNGIPLVRIRDLPSTTTETMYCGPYRDEFIVVPGDYLIGMDGEFRCHIWRGPKGLLNQRVCRLLNFRPTVEPLYIYYGIQKSLREIEATTAFATVKHISAGQIADIELPIPARDEQRRIADLLSRAENIGRMRREAGQMSKETIPALFLDMFGDPATNPRGWTRAKLSDVSQVVSGVAKGRKLKGKGTRDVPYLRVANIQAGFLKLDEVKTISATEEEIVELALLPGDVLLTEGGDHDKLGRGALWNGEVMPCIHQNHVFRVRPHETSMRGGYLVEYLQTAAARHYFLKCAKKTTNLASINMTQLRELPVVVPAIDRQIEFCKYAGKLRRLQQDQQGAIELSNRSLQALLAKVFGEVE